MSDAAADERPRAEPAGLQIDREPEHPEHEQPDRPRRDREVREAEARADERDRADDARDADAGGEELEQHQREPGDEQEVRDPRRVERVRELLREIELAEAARPGSSCTWRFVPDADDRRRRHAHVAGRGVQHLTVEPDDELDRASARSPSIDLVGERGLARQAMVHDRGESCAGRVASRRPSRSRDAVPGVSKSTGTTGPMCAPGATDTYDGGEREQRARAARLAARRPDPHRDRHRRVADRSHERGRVRRRPRPTRRAGTRSSDACALRGVAQRLLDQRRVRRIDQTVHLHDDDAAGVPESRTGGRARPRDARRAPTADDADREQRQSGRGSGADSNVGGSHRPLVACGDGGCAVLLHLPRRHRRGQGRRREDDRDGRAGGDRRARRFERAHRRGRGQIGAADDVRRAGALATTSSTSIPASGPASSRPTPRSSTTSRRTA